MEGRILCLESGMKELRSDDAEGDEVTCERGE